MRRLMAAAFAVAAMTACSPSAGDAEAVATDQVDMPKSYRFEPAAIAVAPATTVTWTNSDNFTHTVRIDGEVVGQAEPGESITHDFDAPGTFAYDCSLHPQDMTGVVTVG